VNPYSGVATKEKLYIPFRELFLILTKLKGVENHCEENFAGFLGDTSGQ
jgi:hypothetical protein